MSAVFDIIPAPSADFKVGDYTFEVGDRNKKHSQISGINVVPLWSSGLWYCTMVSTRTPLRRSMLMVNAFY